ncbi:hypothetical protein SAMN06265373_10265 [Shimia sagamensis]|uniref:Uncharacterized protein n=1 Tax=Shimia sagamensis TaxID=1566352 RepID=A0ABY1NHP2_9RHOB|nr:hypothetical protein SAMN06265373_10265 [Shimia sagamensis]
MKKQRIHPLHLVLILCLGGLSLASSPVFAMVIEEITACEKVEEL